jgi:hypothetical protein
MYTPVMNVSAEAWLPAAAKTAIWIFGLREPFSAWLSGMWRRARWSCPRPVYRLTPHDPRSDWREFGASRTGAA